MPANSTIFTDIGDIKPPEIKGSNLTITDGTHTVAGTTRITVTGATIGGASPNATLTVSGGGGGASILVESGSSAKESAFPAAATNMAAADTVTGLQGGLNVNFSQAQILRTPLNTSTPLYVGTGNTTGGNTGVGNIHFDGGDNFGNGNPGNIGISAGGSSAVAGYSVNGGHVIIEGGDQYYSPTGNGGYVTIRAGTGYLGNGGNIGLYSGLTRHSGKSSGNVYIGTSLAPIGGGSPGHLIFKNIIPTSDPSVSGAIWATSGVLIQSGHTLPIPSAQLPVYAATAGNPGTTVRITAGAGTGGVGGNSYLTAGAGGYGFAGGNTIIAAGQSGYTAGGGSLYLRSGLGQSGGFFSGNIVVEPAVGLYGAATGKLVINNLPTTDPAISNAVWADNGVLVQSGIVNFSGTITAADISTKNFTVVNGIITAFA